MPKNAVHPVIPKEFAIVESNLFVSATFTENGKYDNIFCYVGLSDEDQDFLSDLEYTPHQLMQFTLFAVVNHYKVSVNAAKDEGYYKATLTGLEQSPMPLHVLMSEASDPFDALLAVFYKASLIGFPNAWRVKPKQVRPRTRFS